MSGTEQNSSVEGSPSPQSDRHSGGTDTMSTASCSPGHDPCTLTLSVHPDAPRDLAHHSRYEILGLLGFGGMGTVYQARHRFMDRVVALKVIKANLLERPESVERFRREIQAAARLSHPNIVAAYDADQAGKTHFLVMEFVPGLDLSRLLGAQGRLPVERACTYIQEAALGLQHAYERGMVHRDIKPHNLMLTPEGHIKILDFGLARLVSEIIRGGEAGLGPAEPAEQLAQEAAQDEVDFHTAQTRLSKRRAPVGGVTAAYTALGTADYIAPEEALDPRRADIRADIYSLGCTLFHLLAGQPPFPGGKLIDKIRRHIAETPPPLAEYRDDLPPGLAQVLGGMLAKNPADRFQTPAEVVQALGPFTTPSAYRVLIVEDNADARKALARVLSREGFAVRLAANGREALSLLRQGQLPQLIVLDLLMPVMDGWEFLREQKADPALANIPVLLTSGLEMSQGQALALGAIGYLRKPLEIEELTEKLHHDIG